MKRLPQFVFSHGIGLFVLLLFCLLAARRLEAQELTSRTASSQTIPSRASSSRSLDADWQFRATGSLEFIPAADRAAVGQWHRAKVPGVVQTDLLHNALIPDPFDRDNEFRLQWIGLADWEYQTTFQADAAALGHDAVDLVFDGLETFADVYLNDQ